MNELSATDQTADTSTPGLPPAICVLGMHRGGTSLATRAIELLGVDLGDPDHLMAPGAGNPAGYWENRFIKELDDDLLIHFGGTWDRPPILEPGWELSRELEPFRQRAREVLDASFGERRDAQLIGWKDPRLCLLLPFWRTVHPIVATITIARDPMEVAASVSERNGIPRPEAALLWLRYVLAARAADPHGVIVRQDAFVRHLPDTLATIAERLGLDAPTDPVIASVRAHVQPELLHHSAPETTDIDQHPLVHMARLVWNGGRLDFEAIAPEVRTAIATGWLRPPSETAQLDAARTRAVELNEELRRHKRDVATREEREWLRDVRRAGTGTEWVQQLPKPRETVAGEPPYLVRRAGDGAVFLIESEHRRAVPSPLLADALAEQLGDQRELTDQQVGGWPTGSPVEVLEAPTGPPFVIFGGARHPLRGLPLPYPLRNGDADFLGDGEEVIVRYSPREDLVAARSAQRPLPTFLIIGAQKSATRWLRTNLGEHPEIYTAPVEVQFFHDDRRFHDLGPDWYRSQFVGWDGEAIVGEATPAYMMWRHEPTVVASRIKQVLPDAQLIAILRNPVDRAYSAMLHHKRRGRIPSDASLLELVRSNAPEADQFGLVAGGWYGRSLRPYVKRFGDQLLILLHDDIGGDASGIYARAVAHVGAAAGFEPAELAQVRFSNVKEGASETLSTDERAELYDYFVDDLQILERLTGLDVSLWEPSDGDEQAVDDTADDAAVPELGVG